MPRLLSRLALALACALTLAAGGCEEDAPPAPEGADIAVPSGRSVQLIDVVTDAPGVGGATARFRFLVPGLRAGDDWAADMQALCDTYALPRIDGMVPAPQQIVISVADRVIPFGEPAPDAVQFFEAYRPENGACIWEVF